MTTYTLTRTGQAPLRFDGEQLAAFTTPHNGKDKIRRWYDLATYLASDGRYVASVAFHTTAPSEVDHTWTEVFRSPADLVAVLTSRWPVPPGVGYPAVPAFADKHNRLMEVLSSLYAAGVSAVLVPDVFAVNADAADNYVELRKLAAKAVDLLYELGTDEANSVAAKLDAILGERA